MASGDKLIDGLVIDPRSAEQGASLFSGHPSPLSAHGVMTADNSNTVQTVWVRLDLKVATTAESGVPDFDVEKQYKLTIEEV